MMWLRRGAEQLQSETFTLTRGNWEALPVVAAIEFSSQWWWHWQDQEVQGALGAEGEKQERAMIYEFPTPSGK